MANLSRCSSGALVGGGFGAAAVSVWDKINDTKADIQKVESTVQEAKAGIYKDISDASRGVTQEIKCLIENTAKDQEIARLNRVVDAQRDQNIISQVVAALKGTTTTPQPEPQPELLRPQLQSLQPLSAITTPSPAPLTSTPITV